MKDTVESLVEFVGRSDNFLQGNVSISHGLMPHYQPLQRLPPHLRFIDQLLEELPTLYRDARVCEAIMALPVIVDEDIAQLSSLERIRFNVAFGFLAYSFRYAWEDSQESRRFKALPPVQLAITPVEQRDFSSFELGDTCMRFIAHNVIGPWQANWRLMGRSRPYFESSLFTENFSCPGGTYADPSQITADNSRPLYRFFNTETERNFLLGVQEVTGKFNCIPALIGLQSAMSQRNHSAVVECLEQLVEMWRVITEDVFMRFDTRIDPVEWGSTLGKWTASPFYKQEGFSGMFFPAFHILDLLLKRTSYQSFLGDLIIKTREIMPPNWQRLFQSVGEHNVQDYVDQHGGEHRALGLMLEQMQQVYQLFFKLHRRKVFSYEYQAILTGRSSTNGGISVDVKTNDTASIYELATWNRIDRILQRSSDERPSAKDGSSSRCPFSGRSNGSESAREFPRLQPLASMSGCPHHRSKHDDSAGGLAWSHWDSGLPGVHGVQLFQETPLARAGDRVLLISAEGTEAVEAALVGNLTGNCLTIRTRGPVEALMGIKIIPGTFSRAPEQGIGADHYRESPVLVIAQDGHSAIATVLASQGYDCSLILEGGTVDLPLCEAYGVSRSAIWTCESLAKLSHSQSVPEGTLNKFRRALFYIAGSGEFIERANRFLAENFSSPGQSYGQWLSQLRLEKRNRAMVMPCRATQLQQENYYPWDLLTYTGGNKRVALQGKLLDISDFQFMHFGGDNILKLLAGVDISEEFGRAHPAHDVNMPQVLAIGDYEVPEQLRPAVDYAYRLVRAANVLQLNQSLLNQYRQSPHVYAQRVIASLRSIEVRQLWDGSLFKALRLQRSHIHIHRATLLNLEFSALLVALQEEADSIADSVSIAPGVLSFLEDIYRDSIDKLANALKHAGCYLPIGSKAANAVVEAQLLSIEQGFTARKQSQYADLSSCSQALLPELQAAIERERSVAIALP